MAVERLTLGTRIREKATGTIGVIEDPNAIGSGKHPMYGDIYVYKTEPPLGNDGVESWQIGYGSGQPFEVIEG